MKKSEHTENRDATLQGSDLAIACTTPAALGDSLWRPADPSLTSQSLSLKRLERQREISITNNFPPFFYLLTITQLTGGGRISSKLIFISADIVTVG